MTPEQAITALRGDHAEALAVAAELESVGAGDIESAREHCLSFLEDYLWEHCTTEELVLLPALNRNSADRALAAARRDAYAQLRTSARALTREGDAAAIRAFAQELREHVERAENELYRRFGESRRSA